MLCERFIIGEISGNGALCRCCPSAGEHGGHQAASVWFVGGACGLTSLQDQYIYKSPVSDFTMSESPSKKSKMASSLDQLKDMTVVVADTGDFEGKLDDTCCSLAALSQVCPPGALHTCL